MHYKRWKSHGDTEPRKAGKPYAGRTADQVRRIIAQRTKISPSGCWEWQRSRAEGGYANLSWRGIHLGHRVSYAVHVGAIPDGLHVLHSCDNPPCLNPDHLFVGTIADNNADMDAKGRANRVGLALGREFRGEDHGGAKLTESAVISIRESTETLAVLAERYGVGLMAISRVRNRKSWQHVA